MTLASNGTTGLRHKVMCGENQTIQYQSKDDGESKNAEIRGTVLDSDKLGDISADSILDSVCTRGEPLLANFLPLVKQVLTPGEGQEPQVTTSVILQDPLLPLLRPSPSTSIFA
ncbi:hypothetical protein FRC00_003371 [Tulasnella sp. 408]|nr:hypothetical protein FRC00_003371 [Tulasnella sp. 408]